MVIAGPGTGKTTVLTLRIAQILRKTDTPPSGILAITFTEAGVKAMRQKLRVLMGSRADEVRLHTFHGFAASVISEFHDHFIRLARAKQMTDIDAERLIREVLKNKRFALLRPLSGPDFYVAKITSAISDAKREALSPEDIRAFAKKEIKRIEADADSISTRGASRGKLKAEAEKQLERCERTILFADVYALYEEQKREEKRIDFDDLIIEVLATLKSDTLLLRLLQEQFLYILVDEHQDTNDSQNLLVRMLADFFDSPNLFVVGDEKQAIYRFQGASVENFLTFKKAWKDMKTIPLEVNYRSHQHLLDGAFSLIERNYAEGEHKDLRVKLLSGGRSEKRPIDIVEGKQSADILEHLAKEIRDILQKEKGSTVAVITKTNRDLERVVRFLEDKEIPVASERTVRIFEHPIGTLFFTLIEFLADPTRTEALAKTLAAGLWNVPFESRVECIRALKSGLRGAAEKIPALARLHKKLISDAPIQFLVFAAESSGFLQLLLKDPAYMEVWRGIVELSEQLVRESGSSDPRELLERLLSYKASAEERSVKVSIGTPELSVRVMTAHGSKGLEFDYVFLPFATERSWIGRVRGQYFVLPQKHRNEEDDIRDARRLFYVALTRARKHAVILLSEEDAGSVETPLRFLSELDARYVRHISLPAKLIDTFSYNTNPGSRAKLATGQAYEQNVTAQKLVDLAKHTLLESGLSVTALNHFIECPSRFLFQSILKIPQAPAPSAEKGTAVHEAFARIWQAKNRSAKQIERLFKESVADYLLGSFLPPYEKEAIQKELFEDAPLIARELQGHFTGAARTEGWHETMFVFSSPSFSSFQEQMPSLRGRGVSKKEDKKGSSDSLSPPFPLSERGGGEHIAISLHGKLDATQEDSDAVYVYDYKTKETMTVAAIKGETKSDNGSYWRQLIFYKLLLQNNPRYKGKDIRPALVFAMPDRRGKCGIVLLPVTETDIEGLKREIQRLIDSVWSGHIMNDFCDESKCEWCGMKKIVASS